MLKFQNKMNGENCCFPLENGFVIGQLISKFSPSTSNVYVLNSAFNMDKTKLAVVLSNNNIQVFCPDKKLHSIYAHDKEVTNIKFSSKDPSLLFSSSLDGRLHVWDLRCQKSVQAFYDDSDQTLKPLTCFDYNLDEQYICAGTEVIREDAFLVFWDRRSSEILGGYWNSHTDDITEVHFDPLINSKMATASVDGLINVFDLTEKTEDDALTHTLNVGSGINKFCWRCSDQLSCTTSLEEYQLWSTSEASPSFSASRNDLASDSLVQVDYLIDNIKIAKSWFLATGTYDGKVYLWWATTKGLKPVGCLLQEHSDVIRTISYNNSTKTLTTGGEDGLVCVWRLPSL